MMAKDKSSENVTTLSTRFDDAELAKLKDAADAKQWSLSQLIRVGAYEKAANILNARSPAAYPVRRLLERVVKQLIQPEVMIRDELGTESRISDIPEEILLDPYCTCYATKLKDEDVLELIGIFRKFGAELETIFEDELMRLTANSDNASLLDPAISQSETPASRAPTSAPSEVNPKKTLRRAGKSNTSKANRKE